MNQKKNELKGVFYILITTLIWGYAFVAQKSATEFLDAFSFTGFRSLLGAAAMVPLIIVFNRKKTAEEKAAEADTKSLLLWSFVGALFVSGFSCLQQYGLETADAGKSAFIIALYILFVPVLGIFMKQRVPLKIWLCILIAMAGFSIMCLTNGFSAMNFGDILILTSAILIALHIYVLDHVANKMDVIKFNCMQFLFTGLLCSTVALLFEHPTWQSVVDCAWPLLYAGICSCGFAYLFQVMGQKYLDPAKTSLLLSTESVFALICGMIFLHETLAMKDAIGCILIFTAVLISQIEFKKKETL